MQRAFLAVTLLVATLLANTEANSRALLSDQPAVAGATAATGSAWTLEQLSQFNTPDNCYIAIEGKVYAVTEWIPIHPGGADRIKPWCGQDATEEFTAAHGEEYLPGAQAKLPTFYVADLASSI